MDMEKKEITEDADGTYEGGVQVRAERHTVQGSTCS